MQDGRDRVTPRHDGAEAHAGENQLSPRYTPGHSPCQPSVASQNPLQCSSAGQSTLVTQGDSVVETVRKSEGNLLLRSPSRKSIVMVSEDSVVENVRKCGHNVLMLSPLRKGIVVMPGDSSADTVRRPQKALTASIPEGEISIVKPDDSTRSTTTVQPSSRTEVLMKTRLEGEATLTKSSTVLSLAPREQLNLAGNTKHTKQRRVVLDNTRKSSPPALVPFAQRHQVPDDPDPQMRCDTHRLCSPKL